MLLGSVVAYEFRVRRASRPHRAKSVVEGGDGAVCDLWVARHHVALERAERLALDAHALGENSIERARIDSLPNVVVARTLERLHRADA